MTKMRKHTVRVALMVVGVAMLVTAGAIVAGNMGFKLTIEMEAAGTAPSASTSGTNYIALPYKAKTGVNTARDLFLDIGTDRIQFLNQHRKIDDGFEVYTFGGGTIPPDGWNLKAGEGYIAKIGGSNKSYLVPGTHIPDTVIDLIGGSNPNSASGTNYFAPPYHAVSATARDLFLEIGGDVQFLNQHRKVDDGFEVYTFGGGTIPPNGWNLKPGEALIVKVGGSGQRYIPLHY